MHEAYTVAIVSCPSGSAKHHIFFVGYLAVRVSHPIKFDGSRQRLSKDENSKQIHNLIQMLEIKPRIDPNSLSAPLGECRIAWNLFLVLASRPRPGKFL